MNDAYLIDKRFHTRVERSPRVVEIAEAFGLGLDDKEFVIFDRLELQVRQGDVVYITGQSGSGKSLLLRELRDQMQERGKRVVDLNGMCVRNDATLIDQIGANTNDALKWLSLAGLNDAYLFIRRPRELSDGQRYRFLLAKAMESGADVWVADEFMAVLDRTAAKVISYSVQKIARKVGATVIVATTHTDLAHDLYPSLFIEKRYREKLRLDVIENAAQLAQGATLTKEALYDELLKAM